MRVKDEFYRIFRPQLSASITDESLYHAYEELRSQKRLVNQSRR